MSTTELQVLADDPDRLADIEDPAAAVIDACERANRYLRRALVLDDMSEVREAKAYAAALAGYTRQKELGQDAVLAAQEVIRRANLRIGLAIRDGQSGGTVESLDEARARAARASRQQNDDVVLLKPRPTDYADRDELTREIYPLADAGEAAAERAIERAKAEKNLSRANVIRHVRDSRPRNAAGEPSSEAGSKESRPHEEGSPAPGTQPATTRIDEIADLAATGHSAAQIAERLGVGRDQVVRIAKKHAIAIPAGKSLGRTSKGVDHARVVASTVEQMEGTVMALQVLDVTRLGTGADFDADLEHWTGSLAASLRSIDRMLLQPLKKLNRQRNSQKGTKGDQR